MVHFYEHKWSYVKDRVTHTSGFWECAYGHTGLNNDREPICRGPRSTVSTNDLTDAEGRRM